MATRLNAQAPGFEDAFQRLLEAKRETGADVNDTVRAILSDVSNRGDAAVIDYTLKFDGFELTPESMAFSADEIAGRLGLNVGGIHQYGWPDAKGHDVAQAVQFFAES